MRETILESHYSSTVISRQMDNSNSPGLVSPPDTRTPPLIINKRTRSSLNTTTRLEQAVSEPIDAGGLSQALKHVEEGGPIRERTPAGTPSRKRQRVHEVYGDRLVKLHDYRQVLPGSSEDYHHSTAAIKLRIKSFIIKLVIVDSLP